MPLIGQFVREVAVDAVRAEEAVVVGVAARDGELAAPADVVPRGGRAAALQTLLHRTKRSFNSRVALHGPVHIPDSIFNELVSRCGIGER